MMIVLAGAQIGLAKKSPNCSNKAMARPCVPHISLLEARQGYLFDYFVFGFGRCPTHYLRSSIRYE